MVKLVYLTSASLDGCIEDEQGVADLCEPDDEVFVATTAVLRGFETLLCGRRLYESMSVWETDSALARQSELCADFARVWQGAANLVYSTILTAVSTAATRLECDFNSAAVRSLKAEVSADLTIGVRTWRAALLRRAWSTSASCSSGQ